MYKFRHGSNPNHLIYYGKSCVHHYTNGVAGSGDAYDFLTDIQEEKCPN